MSLSRNKIEQTIEEIDRMVNSSSERYGRLLNWQNPPDPFWHYGIGLSDTHIFDTGQGYAHLRELKQNLFLALTTLLFRPIEPLSGLGTLFMFLQTGSTPYPVGIVNISVD